MAKLLAAIQKALVSAFRTAKSLARMGIRKAGNFSRAALASLSVGGTKWKHHSGEGGCQPRPILSRAIE
ncbi:hypothetical protein EDF68_11351 [Ochrobactrum sp. BH3]|nr:hypothetical protein EDF68_11351 [Ochrobactrum sp. BH3]